MALINTADKIYHNGSEVDAVYFDGNLVWQVGPSLLPETQAILDRADLEGFYKPSSLIITAMDNHIRRMMANGTWWTGLDRYIQFAYNDLLCINFSLIDWRHPTGLLYTVYGGMTFNEYGWKGNGIDGYIDTHYAYSRDGVNYKLGDAGRGLLVNQSSVSKYIFFGNTGSLATEYMQGRNSPHIRMQSNTFSLTTSLNLTGTGLFTQYRDHTMNTRIYIREVENLRAYASLPTSVYDYGVFSLFSNGSGGARSYSDTGISMFYFSKEMTGIENEGHRESLNTYLTDIGLTAIA